MKKVERVQFRLIVMPCCGHHLCWVNPRWPSFCPECGQSIFLTVKQNVHQHDPEAELHVHFPEPANAKREVT